MTRRWFVDAVERVGFTYVESVVGLVLANMAGITNLDTWRTAAVAALPATLAAMKSLIAGTMPGTVSPASMASEPHG